MCVDIFPAGGGEDWWGERGDPVQRKSQTVPLESWAQSVEGARCGRHQDPFPPYEEMLPHADEMQASAKSLCQPHHQTKHGAKAHEYLG